jgi:hypothetical protein
MTLIAMYPGMVNSPELTLTNPLGANPVTDTTITVTGDISKLPVGPNLMVIGTGEDAETVFYPLGQPVGNVFTGVTRGFDGSITKAWLAGEVVGRNFCNYDHATFITNITTHDSPSASLWLMPGGAFLPTADFCGWEQGETTINKNCYMYGEFSFAALNRMMWTVPVPIGFTAGINMTATFYWTADTAEAGTVEWNLAAYRPADGITIDTVVANVANATDTFLGANLMHVTAETAAFQITGDGRFIFFELTRDYTTDTLAANARILAIEVKYVRSQNY